MPINFGNIQGNIVDSTGQGPGAVSAPSNQGNLVVSGGPHSDGPRQYEREFTPSPSPVDISGFPSQADQANFELQNLVKNKDYLQQFPSTQTPGTNLYQEGIANFINTSPLNREIYKDTFPIGGAFNLFMTEVPEKIFGNTIAGSIIKSLTAAKEGIGGLKEKITNAINPKFEDPYSQASSSYNYGDLNIEGYPDEIQRRLQIGPISEEDTSETNIEAIKDEKNILKSNKIKNAQDTFAFYNTLNNPSNVLPPNFAETFERLKDTNQLSSGDFLKANQLLRDIVPTNPNPPMINAQTTGINQVLPKEVQTATNLFSNFQPNIKPIVDKVSEYSTMLSDDKGLDVDLLNQGVSYSTPLFGGTVTGEISNMGGDNPTAGLFFNKVI